MTLTRN